jgi:excisionase family DNA binding protein
MTHEENRVAVHLPGGVSRPDGIRMAQTEPLDAGPAWETRLLRVTEAAQYLAISRSKLYSLMRANEVASVMAGGSRRITLGALVDYVNRISAKDPQA